MAHRDRYNNNNSNNYGQNRNNKNHRSGHFDSNGRWGKEGGRDDHRHSSAPSDTYQGGRDRDRNYQPSNSNNYNNLNTGGRDNNASDKDGAFGSIAQRIINEREEEARKLKEKKEEEAMTEDQLLEKQLGFSSFRSTKGKSVAGANPFFARVEKKRKFTQYLNKNPKKGGAVGGGTGDRNNKKS